MILFIFEGKNDEPRLYKTLKEIFHFELKEEEIIHYFCNNIFSLYDTLKSYSEDVLDDSVDLVNVLKEDAFMHEKSHTELDKIKYSSEISEIFLFFDYDIRKQDEKNKLTIEEQNAKIVELFNYFENGSLDSERNGIKLYINYPMIESYRFFKKELPDVDFRNYTFDLLSEKSFKHIVNEESFYQNLKYLCFDIKKSGEVKTSVDKERIKKIKQNWLHLKELNIKKAHFICTDNYSIPENKDTINQQTIFDKQIEKYIKPNNEVAILNAFPLFWFEYIDENKLDESNN
ncbi:MAG: hypothetical protein IAA16_01235 [Candidatus Treponema excrementipullorum]|uniref:DUF4435 domain-containing protein n=1 Tax=Candidatus Treponema excrementipullorum TaxID=2838768 RepID=A0A9E2L0S6_9SPIR|nr:hypothetical protein [Candidatus Treponema excrementipullorum]